ncbi:uncharacterized protein [Aegilops tauschii subsp. strangulata]|uniref:uncharacterized protein n=1 Tax=Aegilops tauschii subsp. strangulata TaxID=200361 RepID=UPI003CC85213
MEEITTKKTKKRPAIVVSPGDSDEAAMARFAREYPECVQAKQEFWWKRDVEQEKKKEDEAGPSTVIPIEFDLSDWGDSNEDEGCDVPDKDEFWEQFRSPDVELFHLRVVVV